jgi:2'-5' RNA ligase
VRLFIAANFDAQLRAVLHQQATPLRAAAPDISWVPSERLHSTLKFLGEQNQELLPRLTKAIGELVVALQPIDLSVGAYGAFPNFRRARVVWRGIEPVAQLAALASGIDEVCSTFGVAREERPYRAHVTLGRVKRPLSALTAKRLEQAALARHEVVPWHVGSIEIMHSTVAGKGPTYVPLASVSLGAGS